jgi:hypothetical protein
MSRKDVSWSILLLLIWGALLSAPASAQHFEQVKGSLFSVAAGRNEVFGIGAGGLAWRYNPTTRAFDKVAGSTSFIQIAVGGGTLSQLDAVWAVADNGGIYRFNYQTKVFDQVPGKDFVQVAVGEGDQDKCHPYEVWGVQGNNSLYRYDYCTSQFVSAESGGVTQVATSGGDVWILDTYDTAFDTSKFKQLIGGVETETFAGELSEIAVGVNSAWGIDSANSIYRYDPSTNQFVQVSGTLGQIAAGGDGVWGIDLYHDVYRFDPITASWVLVPGLLQNISVGSGAGVWGTSPSNQVFTFVRP